MEYIELDGSQGEGGGQILRSALSLSMITGKPFRMDKIRAKRGKPGLLRQHLTAVRAARDICGAEVEGDELGSLRLTFKPGKIYAGDYNFSIGSAGSCTLVLQTVLPALLFADAESQIYISGGTHNPAAPPADFLIRSWQPVLKKMGIDFDINLHRHGFYPAGGGKVHARVKPAAKIDSLDLSERGKLRSIHATAVISGIPANVAERELSYVRKYFPAAEIEYKELDAFEGPGNVLMIEVEHEHVTELFCGFGQKGVSAESVAKHVVEEVRRYIKGKAGVGEYMSDQLLIPMALSGRGIFTTQDLSSHLMTNISVIERFLPVQFKIDTTKGVHSVQVL